MSYISEVIENVKKKNPGETEFHQAVTEVLNSLEPVIKKNEKKYRSVALLERLTEPNRIIEFSVPWVDDKGVTHVNKGFRVQFNNAIGPYKGGFRFHPTVNRSVLKFLGFEQIFKNSLTGLPMGGGKGGSDFDPKGKSDNEIMKFCQSFMAEAYKYIGRDIDIPAGDIGVGAREVGYLFGMYKKLSGKWEGAITGKGISYGGSLVRKEATGFGVGYIANEILEDHNDTLEGKRVGISGSGNVAIYAAQKFIELGAKVVTMSDSDGYIYDSNGIDIEKVKQIKEVKRGRIKEYKGGKYHSGKPWGEKMDIASPCATQNELGEKEVKTLIKNGVKLIVEGANMPLTNEAIDIVRKSKVLYMPGKAANAGGVSVSGLEIAQNSMGVAWSFNEVDEKLKEIMKNIYAKVKECATKYSKKDDFVSGANIAGFIKVADAMIAQGVV